MVPSLICAVLAGLLMSQGARAWLLLAVVIGAILTALTAGYIREASIGGIIGHALMIGVAIEAGYALGLFGRLFVSRPPRSQTGDISLGKH